MAPGINSPGLHSHSNRSMLSRRVGVAAHRWLRADALECRLHEVGQEQGPHSRRCATKGDGSKPCFYTWGVGASKLTVPSCRE